ncbi:hypothetical protein ID866_11118 [Astraeus odoratus]|nr:hypothetical protein ID866_11118 [Astraeus odoratus]
METLMEHDTHDLAYGKDGGVEADMEEYWMEHAEYKMTYEAAEIEAVGKYLDTTKCRSLQHQQAMENVKQQFPHLYDYEDCWPIHDLALLHLKYLSLNISPC